jgi:cytochrome c553
MKKLTLLSVAVAALLFVGCGDDKKETAAPVAEKTTEVAKSTTQEAKDAVSHAVEKVTAVATEKATEAVEATKEAASAVATKTAAVATEAKDAVVEKATEAKAAVVAATTAEAPASFKACGGCHGAKGEKKAMGKSAVIAGQSKEELVTKINGYKAGTLNVVGMGALMKGQVAKLSDADIDAVATYLSGL